MAGLPFSTVIASPGQLLLQIEQLIQPLDLMPNFENLDVILKSTP